VADLSVPEGWRERLESLVGRRRDAWIVVGLVVGVLAVLLFLRLRAAPPLVAPPAAPQVGGAIPTPMPSQMYVHVAGEVRKPGLYALAAGQRVADAIAAAGGSTRRGDLDAVNLAETLVDGVKIDVPRRGADVTESPQPSEGVASTTSSLVNVNSADALTLESVPGIGPVIAGAIVQHREENGAFASVDALIDVSGIGPSTLESIRAYVTV
jgi:competence protein ComEA